MKICPTCHGEAKVKDTFTERASTLLPIASTGATVLAVLATMPIIVLLMTGTARAIIWLTGDSMLTPSGYGSQAHLSPNTWLQLGAGLGVLGGIILAVVVAVHFIDSHKQAHR